MTEPFLAMLILFGGNFAIRGWAMCMGQIISIAQNTALFSLLGTTYGGNGQTTFALPDLRGRAAVGTGQGIGLSNYNLGQITGTENTTLLITNMPAHNHVGTLSNVTVTTPASTAAGTTNVPGPTMVPAALPTIGSGPGATQIKGYKVQDSTTTLAPGTAAGTVTIGIAGGNQPFSLLNPSLALTYLIALEGIFPSRN
jgi:microcystin-dependent protein